MRFIGRVPSCSPEHRMSHEVWRKVRRPFRYPSCTKCKWEVYDVNQAGCLKCGGLHECLSNSVDNKCPLVQCDDRTRVCLITGYILPEVRHALQEYTDTTESVERHACAVEIAPEVHSIVANLLQSERATRCREQENARQYARLTQNMHRQMRLFKLAQPGVPPNVCHILASAISQERYWRFIEEASDDLVEHCTTNITKCLIELRSRGVKLASGTRLQDMVCGLLYMLKTGLIFKDRMLLLSIPEIDRCLPHENKIESYFGISSKVICMTENEVKLLFRESYQT